MEFTRPVEDQSGPQAVRATLKAERMNAGLTLQQRADEIGVPYSALRRAELGLGVRLPQAKRIADFYGVRVTDLWPVEERVA